jgi:SAM-dependent methyltransferase
MPLKFREIRRRAQQRLLGFEPLFWASLATHARALRPRSRPEEQRANVALRSTAEWHHSSAEVERLGLKPHNDGPKNWDALIALDLILRNTSPASAVLDAGAEVYSPLLKWLYWYGYRNLHGINLVFDGPFKRGPISYVPGDITQSPYPDARFDAITCLSVIEHGVDVPAFLRESHRILRPGGLLVISCDYHADPTPTAGQTAYGMPVHVFNRAEIESVLTTARDIGFEPTSPAVLDCAERPVHWARLGIDFTFLVLALRKINTIHTTVTA